jgi:hypothetical protein
MPISFACPHCGHRTEVAEQFAGQSGPCARCGQTISIPRAAGPGQPGAPAARSGGSGVGIVLGVVGAVLVVLLLCGGVVAALVYSGFSAARQAGQRTASANNLRQIGIALHNYADVYQSFPPAYTVDPVTGQRLHSWRVLILPFLEEAYVYDQLDLTRPWDDPVNRQFEAHMPSVYCFPAAQGTGQVTTDYMVVVGPETAFPGEQAAKMSDVYDGLSNTIAVVEVAGSTTSWMEPTDLDFAALDTAINGAPGNSISSNEPSGANVLMCDGAARFLETTIAPELVRFMLMKSDGQSVPYY